MKRLISIDEVEPVFKIGDVIQRKALAIYNYDRPIMEIEDIRDRLYIFKSDGPVPMALDIWAQDEWELYEIKKSWLRRSWEWLKDAVKKLFRYHQPVKISKLNLKKIGHQKKRPGLTMFMYNKKTGVISKAQLIDGNKVIANSDCIYRQALNKKSFIKRLRKEGYDVPTTESC